MFYHQLAACVCEDDRADEDSDYKCRRFTESLEKGYHHTELMVYTPRRAGDIFDSTVLQCKHGEEE